jgi:hypothetical protein
LPWQLAARNQAVAILDKIAWFATKHSALRAVHVFITNRAATTTITINCYAYRFATKRGAKRSARLCHHWPPPQGFSMTINLLTVLYLVVKTAKM